MIMRDIIIVVIGFPWIPMLGVSFLFGLGEWFGRGNNRGWILFLLLGFLGARPRNYNPRIRELGTRKWNDDCTRIGVQRRAIYQRLPNSISNEGLGRSQTLFNVGLLGATYLRILMIDTTDRPSMQQQLV